MTIIETIILGLYLGGAIWLYVYLYRETGHHAKNPVSFMVLLALWPFFFGYFAALFLMFSEDIKPTIWHKLFGAVIFFLTSVALGVFLSVIGGRIG